MQIEKLTESEEIVMKAIWICGKEPGLTDVMGVVTEIYHKDWKPQTVSTFLAKLVRKNYIQLKRNGKIYTYKILVPEKVYRRKLYKHHISFWNHNDIVEFVEEMIKNGDLPKEIITEMESKD